MTGVRRGDRIFYGAIDLGFDEATMDKRVRELAERERPAYAQLVVKRIPGHPGPPRKFSEDDWNAAIALADQRGTICQKDLHTEYGWSYDRCKRILVELVVHGQLVRGDLVKMKMGRPKQGYHRPGWSERSAA